MIVGCYSTDLYCCYSPQARTDVSYDQPGAKDPAGHDFDAFPVSLIGRNMSDTYAQAREKGWRLAPDWNKALCPMCVKLNRRIFEDDRQGWLPHANAQKPSKDGHDNPQHGSA